jgi:hypothetical protein
LNVIKNITYKIITIIVFLLSIQSSVYANTVTSKSNIGVSYQYNNKNQLITKCFGKRSLHYSYDSEGQITKEKYGNQKHCPLEGILIYPSGTQSQEMEDFSNNICSAMRSFYYDRRETKFEELLEDLFLEKLGLKGRTKANRKKITNYWNENLHQFICTNGSTSEVIPDNYLKNKIKTTIPYQHILRYFFNLGVDQEFFFDFLFLMDESINLNAVQIESGQPQTILDYLDWVILTDKTHPYKWDIENIEDIVDMLTHELPESGYVRPVRGSKLDKVLSPEQQRKIFRDNLLAKANTIAVEVEGDYREEYASNFTNVNSTNYFLSLGKMYNLVANAVYRQTDLDIEEVRNKWGIKSLEAIRRGIELSPSQSSAFCTYAISLDFMADRGGYFTNDIGMVLGEGDLKYDIKALEAYDQCIKSSKTPFYYYDNFIRLLLKEGEYEQALNVHKLSLPLANTPKNKNLADLHKRRINRLLYAMYPKVSPYKLTKSFDLKMPKGFYALEPSYETGFFDGHLLLMIEEKAAEHLDIKRKLDFKSAYAFQIYDTQGKLTYENLDKEIFIGFQEDRTSEGLYLAKIIHPYPQDNERKAWYNIDGTKNRDLVKGANSASLYKDGYSLERHCNTAGCFGDLALRDRQGNYLKPFIDSENKGKGFFVDKKITSKSKDGDNIYKYRIVTADRKYDSGYAYDVVKSTFRYFLAVKDGKVTIIDKQTYATTLTKIKYNRVSFKNSDTSQQYNYDPSLSHENIIVGSQSGLFKIYNTKGIKTGQVQTYIPNESDSSSPFSTLGRNLFYVNNSEGYRDVINQFGEIVHSGILVRDFHYRSPNMHLAVVERDRFRNRWDELILMDDKFRKIKIPRKIKHMKFLDDTRVYIELTDRTAAVYALEKSNFQ